jgi:caffeoyl-CoA O-methyltransferase
LDYNKPIQLTPRILDYVREQAEPATPAQSQLISDTRALGGPAEMQIPHVQGVLLTLLAKVIRAATIVEVGTFTGYSALALAYGLEPGGQVITHDISDQWSDIATRAWQTADMLDRIQRKVGPAARTLRELPEMAFIDLAFIDADKVGYIEYWEILVPRLRPGGLILADNVLYSGEAADDEPGGNGRAIRNFNAHVRADDRVKSVLLPIADGLTIARREDRKD